MNKILDMTNPERVDPRPVNILSVDFEEYYQGILTVDPAEYDSWPGRLEPLGEKLLDLLDKYSARATFFVSGHVALRYPQLVSRIAARGHEIACHGFRHGLIYELTQSEFAEDLDRARDGLSHCVNVDRVIGFRAPWWSINSRCPWAWEILESRKFLYDSSINPIRMRYYGDPRAPLTPYRIEGTGLWEFPPAAVKLAGLRLSVAGGFYWRHYPLYFIRWALRRLNRQGVRAVCYFHPWEIDTGQPKIGDLPLEQRLIHFSGRASMERKIRAVLAGFRFGSFREVYGEEKGW